MDDSFAFSGTPDPRRLDPWALRLGVAGIVILLVAGVFLGWAVSSERSSFRRLDEAKAVAARQALAQSRQIAVAEATSSAVAVPATAPPTEAAQQAQDEAFAALRAAKALHRRTGTFAAAGPAALTASESGTLFVDGPSVDPQIVSVAASDTTWAAAVMSSEGMCYYVMVAPTDAVRFGTGVGCTGADAMGATGSAW